MTSADDVAYETMAHITRMNDENNRLTLYAVVCPEHGGLVVTNAREAVEGAAEANTDGPCVYFPIALAVDPRRMPELPTFGEDEV